MRNGTLACALLCTALGIALGCSPRRVSPFSVLVAASTAILSASMVHASDWTEGVYLGCWLSIAGTAASVHAPQGLSRRSSVLLSMNSGYWSGAISTISNSYLDLLIALPCILVLVPVGLIVRARLSIIVKVIASWLIAVASLAAALQFLPVTPGYLPDHLE